MSSFDRKHKIVFGFDVFMINILSRVDQPYLSKYLSTKCSFSDFLLFLIVPMQLDLPSA